RQAGRRDQAGDRTEGRRRLARRPLRRRGRGSPPRLRPARRGRGRRNRRDRLQGEHRRCLRGGARESEAPDPRADGTLIRARVGAQGPRGAVPKRRTMPKQRLALVAAVAGVAFVAASPSAPAENLSSPAAACAGRYRVRSGDTLSALARRFRTTVPALARANSMHPNGVLLAGRLLRVPSACAKAPSAPKRAVRPSSLAASLNRALAVPGTVRGRTGVVVVDLASSTVVYALNPELPLEPASTEKLPVALTALQRLGAGFRTYTAVFGSGSRSGATWSGDLVLKGFGDPMLTSQGLKGLARAIRNQGITAVSGGVVGDESYFDAQRTAPGWKGSFAKTESPLLSALVVDRGVLDGRAVDHPALAAA